MMSSDHNEQALYEIPNCTICLNELYDDLTNLNCGHVFHMSCISQHFQYRGTCPNCQKRSHEKEIRLVVYPLTKNTQSAELMRQMLGNLSGEEKEQVQVLFKEVQAATQKNEKLQSKLVQAQKQQKKATRELNAAKLEANRAKSDLQALKKDSIQLKAVIQHLHSQIKSMNEQNFNIRLELQSFKEKQSQYEKHKKLRRIMSQRSQDIINYKNELQNKNESAEQRARLFFDMILIKNLDVMKLKQKFEEYPLKIRDKQQEISKLKQLLDRQKRQAKDVHEKRCAEKKKYEELKTRYRNLIEKYRAKCQGGLSDEENYEDSMLSRPSFPIIPVNVKTGTLMASNSNKGENTSTNIPMKQNKNMRKNQSGNFDSIMEVEESVKQASKNNQIQKKTTQQSLSSFVTQKNTYPNAFGSFGGVVAKKRAQDNKVMKNIFG